MLNNWAARTITLSSLVLRVVTASQAATCTSLLAALLIEQYYWPLSRIAQLSLFRSMENSPIELFQFVLRVNPRIMAKALLYTILLVALVISSLIIQFSSTILLSDLGTIALVEFPRQLQHNVSLSESTLDIVAHGLDAMRELRHGFPTFAELETVRATEPNLNGVSDTGVIKRALLPFEKANRTTLRAFKGPTASMVTRVSCLPAYINATFTRDYPDGGWPFGKLLGNISYHDTFGNSNTSYESCKFSIISNTTACLPTKISCGVSLGGSKSSAETLSEWGTALCHLPIAAIELNFPKDANSANTDPTSIQDGFTGNAGKWGMDTDPWDPTSYWPFLVLATNANLTLLKTMNMSGITTIPLQAPTRYQEWNSFKLEETSQLNVSLCSAAINMSLADVEFSSTVDPREPEIQINQLTRYPDAEDAQILFGASGILHTSSERGILSMDGIKHLNASFLSGELNPFQPGMGTGSAGSFLFYNSIAFWGYTGSLMTRIGRDNSVNTCVRCWAWGELVSRDISALFNRVINTTGRAALAIDSFLSIITMNSYYELLPGFNVPGTIEVAFSRECTVPRHWRGITVVISTIAVHLLCSGIVTLLFIRRTRYTREGNVWHAVSQLVSDTTRPALEISNELRDKDVTHAFRGNDELVKIERSAFGTVEVIKCRNDIKL